MTARYINLHFTYLLTYDFFHLQDIIESEAAAVEGQRSCSDDTTTQKTASTLPEQTGTGIGTDAFYSKRLIRKPKWLINTVTSPLRLTVLYSDFRAQFYDTVFCKCNWLVNRLTAQNIINILL